VIFEQFPEAELLAGVATAGIAWGAMTADQLKLPFIYVRPKPKEHGLGNQIEGFFEPGQKTVVVEDLISTGQSSLRVVEVLRNSGVKIMGMVSIFNYGFDAAEQAFKKAGVVYESLTNYTSLIELAIEKNIISEKTEQLLLNWRTDPANWPSVAKTEST
jgi:orotate phosphoribosyltransferase